MSMVIEKFEKKEQKIKQKQHTGLLKKILKEKNNVEDRTSSTRY